MTPRPQRFGVALLLGILTAFSLPPWGWWVLTPVGLAAAWIWITRSTSDGSEEPARRDSLFRFWRSAKFWTAWWFWTGFYLVGLVWMIDLTIPGWLVAIPVEAAIMALPMMLANDRKVITRLPSALIVGEAIRWVVPFGGVPMANLALAQVGAPWMSIVRVSGALALVGMVGLVAATLVVLQRRQSISTGIAFGMVFVAMWLTLLAPTGRTDQTIEAAVVQAGGQLGTNAVNDTQRSVFERHVDAMELLTEPVDLVVWSESSASSGRPLDTSIQMGQIEQLADEHDAIIIANFSERDGEFFRNATVAVAPEVGLTGRYDKVHLVPFGEYVPLRSFIDRFADLSLIPREALPGEDSALLDTPLGPMSTVTSFEVYFPERVRSGVRNRGRIVLNPTLASSYTTSMVAEQSLASARLRAVESGRWVLQASTTGYAAIVDHNGDVIERTGLTEQAVKTATVELRSGHTWAITFGKWPITLLALFFVLTGRGKRKGRRAKAQEAARAEM
jgi:apolipoprotein N-acyltransferase